MKAPAKLSAKQQRFVDEYLVDLNATQAAIRAGYGKRGAQVQGSRLLSNAMVRAAIEAKQEKRAAVLDISADRIERELSLVAFSDLRDVMRWGADCPLPPEAIEALKGAGIEVPRTIADLEPKDAAFLDELGIVVSGFGVSLIPSTKLDERARAISAVKETQHGISVTMHDKLKALELLGKRHGMWQENINLKGNLLVQGSWLDIVKAANAEAADADAKKPK